MPYVYVCHIQPGVYISQLNVFIYDVISHVYGIFICHIEISYFCIISLLYQICI